MENTPEKIANLHLQILENCSEKEKNIINLYWKLQGIEFVNSAKWIKAEFEIPQGDLNKLIATYSVYSSHDVPLIPVMMCHKIMS